MQSAYAYIDGEIEAWTLPSPEEEVLPGVPWGAPEQILSPAYWAALSKVTSHSTFGFVSTDGDLASELGFCLLGGFGITAELATAAHDRLSEAGIFLDTWQPNREEVRHLLTIPLNVGRRTIRYRFPEQRATRITASMERLRDCPPRIDCPFAMRNDLMTYPGVGPKTASWIVRNLTGSNSVAILDIHVIRAGQVMGLFPLNIRLPNDYEKLEDLFLRFASRIGVGAASLDALIWSQMRRFPVDITRYS